MNDEQLRDLNSLADMLRKEADVFTNQINNKLVTTEAKVMVELFLSNIRSMQKLVEILLK